MRSSSPHRRDDLAAPPVPPPTSRRVGRRALTLLRTALLLVAVTAVYLGALEFILAAAGISPIVEDTDPYVGFSSQIPLLVRESAPDGEEMMATAGNKLDLFNMQRFPARKASGTYRIFCMGGSTTYGRPYDDATSFCGWLRAILPKADPARRWEVINAGGISYASYRVRMLMEELVQYEPDLFIVYTGHNEFLERRTYGPIMDTPAWLREAGAALHRTRTYAALTRMANWAGGRAAPREDARPRLPGEVDAILDETLGPESYHRGWRAAGAGADAFPLQPGAHDRPRAFGRCENRIPHPRVQPPALLPLQERVPRRPERCQPRAVRCAHENRN